MPSFVQNEYACQPVNNIADTAIGLTSFILTFFFTITTDSSLKHQILKDNYTRICDQVAAKPYSITRLVDKLHSKEFITLDTMQAVNHITSLHPYDRATTMLRPAIYCCSPHNVDGLIEILKEFRIEIPPSLKVCFYN